MLSYDHAGSYQNFFKFSLLFMVCSVSFLQVQVWFPTFVTLQKEKQNAEQCLDDSFIIFKSEKVRFL